MDATPRTSNCLWILPWTDNARPCHRDPDGPGLDGPGLDGPGPRGVLADRVEAAPLDAGRELLVRAGLLLTPR